MSSRTFIPLAAVGVALLGVGVGAWVSFAVAKETHKRTVAMEIRNRLIDELRRKEDSATSFLASLNSLTFEVVGTPSSEYLNNSRKVDNLRARWAALRPYLFEVLVSYEETLIRDAALQLTTAVESFIDLTSIPLVDPEEHPDEFERELADRRKVRKEVMTYSHILLAAIQQRTQEVLKGLDK